MKVINDSIILQDLHAEKIIITIPSKKQNGSFVDLMPQERLLLMDLEVRSSKLNQEPSTGKVQNKPHKSPMQTDPKSSASSLPVAEDKMSKGDLISHHILSQCGQTRKPNLVGSLR